MFPTCTVPVVEIEASDAMLSKLKLTNLYNPQFPTIKQ